MEYKHDREYLLRIFKNPVILHDGRKSFWFKYGKTNINIPKSMVTLLREKNKDYAFLVPGWWLEKNSLMITFFGKEAEVKELL